MNALELKVFPVVVALAFGAAMWFASALVPTLAFTLPWAHLLALALGSAGIIIALTGAIAFRRAKTTVNPFNPSEASTLVTSGIYRLSRNPMYLGLLLALAALSTILSHLLAFLLLPAFVAYMNHFQIAPEERALSAKFGVAFIAYQQSVRRWL